ncbi:hypothetical protein D3C83_166780 [compost metagenome]
MRRIAVVDAPLEKGAQQVRLGGNLFHRGADRYLRITFSEGVSASMNAGREKMRSAYFISGAASLPSLTP